MNDPSHLAATLALILLVLALMVLCNIYLTRRTEREHPARGLFVMVGGVRLHYLDVGQGPPVVLLHGNLVTAEDYLQSGVLERIAERHRVIAFDRPGYGYSDRPHGVLWTAACQAELLHQALVQIGVVCPVVVGHSWGTLVALKMALNHQEDVAGLVLLAGYYTPTPRLDVLLATPPAIPLIGGLLRYTLSPLMGWALLPLTLKAMFSPLAVSPRLKRGYPYFFLVRPSQIRAESQDGAIMVPTVMRMHDRYRELRLPIFVMAGTEDKVVSHKRHAVWFHEQLPASHLQLVPGAGHMVHYAAPERVAEAVERIEAEAPVGTRATLEAEARPGMAPRPMGEREPLARPAPPGRDRA